MTLAIYDPPHWTADPIDQAQCFRWLADGMIHLDKCVDEIKVQATTNLQLFLHQDKSISDDLAEHKKQHELLSATEKGKWKIISIQAAIFKFFIPGSAAGAIAGFIGHKLGGW